MKNIHQLTVKEMENEKWEEAFASSAERKLAKKNLFDAEETEQVDVKLEHPFFIAIQAEKKVLTRAEKTIRQLIAAAKKDVVTLHATSETSCLRTCRISRTTWNQSASGGGRGFC